MVFDHRGIVESAFGVRLPGRRDARSEFSRTLATNLRQANEGDSYGASVIGVFESAGGVKSPVQGTATVDIRQTNYEESVVHAITSLLSLTIDGKPQNTTTIRYYRHNPVTGDLLVLANAFTERRIVPIRTPSIDTPGIFREGLSLSQVRVYADGENDLVTLTVIGAETVQTPLGNFQCWKCEETSNNSVSLLTANTWYAPQLGSIPIVEHDTITFKDTGDVLTLETVMNATNIRFAG